MLMKNDGFSDKCMADLRACGSDALAVRRSMVRDDDARQRLDRGFEVAVGSQYRSWHVLMCESSKELVVASRLRERGVVVFAPKISVKKVKVRGCFVERPDRAVFHGYVFVCVPNDGDVFNALSSVGAVFGVLRRDGAAVVIGIAKMLDMQAKDELGRYGSRMPSEVYAWIKCGVGVVITDGLLGGYKGVVEKRSSDRVTVVVDYVGVKTTTIVSLDMIDIDG